MERTHQPHVTAGAFKLTRKHRKYTARATGEAHVNMGERSAAEQQHHHQRQQGQRRNVTTVKIEQRGPRTKCTQDGGPPQAGKRADPKKGKGKGSGRLVPDDAGVSPTQNRNKDAPTRTAADESEWNRSAAALFARIQNLASLLKAARAAGENELV